MQWPADEFTEFIWCDVATRMLCAARRNQLMFWCGYVELPRGHPLLGVHYSDDTILELRVHGGVTFSDDLYYDGGWWLGWDSGHAWDEITFDPVFNEKMSAILGQRLREWDEKDVIAETARLAGQLVVYELVIAKEDQ